jgi:ferric-dicitrate binding protein FerR (iron transport regulator)
MLNERLAQLLARKLSGEATPGELEELHEYLQAHQDDQYFAELLSTYWNHHQDKNADEVILANQQFQRILEQVQEESNQVSIITQSRSRIFLFWKIAIAAMLTGAIITTYFLWLRQSSTNQLASDVLASGKHNEVATKAGARSHILLPDGSQVWLNSSSKLTYAELFTDTTREVTLEGEGYFEVVKDPSRPFIVHTEGVDVRVLGTAFNLKSYPKESTVEAVLVRGMLEVTNTTNPHSSKVILRPHEKIVFKKELRQSLETGEEHGGRTSLSLIPSKGKPVSTIEKNIADSAIMETSWVYNKLVFDEETFEELALKMERWFDVTIEFKSEKVKKYKLGGSFSNQSIQQAMEALQLIAAFEYKIDKNRVEIYGR